MLFVGGVHAVGKTFLLKPACEGLGLRHATASQLIREQRGLATWTPSRMANDIDENQRALVDAARRLTGACEGVVLDGHFVLRRETNAHEKINAIIFADLMIRGAILLECSSAIVLERLRQRGDDTWTIAEIERFAETEALHGKAVCSALGIPLLRLNSPSVDDVSRSITQLLHPHEPIDG